MMGMSACNRYSPSWEEDADGTKQESLQSVLGIPDIIGTEIDNAALLRSVTDSYCMVSDENKDQSALLQKAIDDMAGQGGGNLLIPAGTYCFAEVYMKSGVHILVHKDAVLKPYWGEKTISCCISPRRMILKTHLYTTAASADLTVNNIQ